jgi:hypothetical protein
MKRTMATRLALAIGIALCSGCGSGTGTGDTVDSFIVDINNQWTVQGAVDHTFSFVCSTTDPQHEASTCSFTGNEQLNGSSSDLSGTYTGRQIQFTVFRSTAAAHFDGTFSDKNTMTLHGPNETLTVTRG